MVLPVDDNSDNPALNEDIVVHCIGSHSPTRRVFLLINVFSLPLECLVDSGADISLITRSTFDKLNSECNPPLVIDSEQSTAFQALSPNSVMYTCGTIFVDIRLDNFIATQVRLHVVEDHVTSHEVILGADFLGRHYLAPSPAHRRLVYLPPGEQPLFVGEPAQVCKTIILKSPVTLKPNSICFIRIPKPDVTWREALF